MSGKIESLLKQISEAASDVIGMIQSIDAKIQTLNAQRQAINDAPVGRSDFVAYIGRWIDQQTERFSISIAQELHKIDRSFASLERGSFRLNLLTGAVNIPVVISEDAALWYLKPAIMTRIEELTGKMEFPSGKEDVPAEKRRGLIAAIDREIESPRAERDDLAGQLLRTGVTG